MSRYQCLIFDLDGTLADTLDDIYLAWKHALSVLGLPEVPRERIKPFVGPARDVYLPGILGKNAAEYGDRAMQLYTEYYTAHCTDCTRLFSGIPELLAAVHSRFTLAAASNKPSPQVRRILEGLGIVQFFKHIYGPDLVARGKPAPDMFFAIAKKEGILPPACLAVGDTFNDLQAGDAAGMDVVAVLWGFGDETSLRSMHPSFVAARPGDLSDYLGVGTPVAS